MSKKENNEREEERQEEKKGRIFGDPIAEVQ